MEHLNSTQLEQLKRLADLYEVSEHLDLESMTFEGHYPILDAPNGNVIGIAGADGDYRLDGRIKWSQMQYPALPGEVFDFDEKNEVYILM